MKFGTVFSKLSNLSNTEGGDSRIFYILPLETPVSIPIACKWPNASKLPTLSTSREYCMF